MDAVAGASRVTPVIRTKVRVADDGSITGHVPGNVPPGEHAAAITVAEPAGEQAASWDLPVDDCGPWPSGVTLRREEIYGEDGR